MKHDWSIARGTADWECDWHADALFHLRQFRALSITEKLRAVEAMCDAASYFSERAQRRRALARSKPRAM